VPETVEATPNSTANNTADTTPNTPGTPESADTYDAPAPAKDGTRRGAKRGRPQFHKRYVKPRKPGSVRDLAEKRRLERMREKWKA
jgi:hypothetical protein